MIVDSKPIPMPPPRESRASPIAVKKMGRGCCPVCKRDRATAMSNGNGTGRVVMRSHHGPTSFDTTTCPGTRRPPLPLTETKTDEVSERRKTTS